MYTKSNIKSKMGNGKKPTFALRSALLHYKGTGYNVMFWGMHLGGGNLRQWIIMVRQLFDICMRIRPRLHQAQRSGRKIDWLIDLVVNGLEILFIYPYSTIITPSKVKEQFLSYITVMFRCVCYSSDLNLICTGNQISCWIDFFFRFLGF